MKKCVWVALIVLCAARVFAQPSDSGSADTKSGVIKELSGTVELKHAGQVNFIPAKSGDVVAKDTVVSTGFKSSALIALGSAMLTVRPLTCMTLLEISAAVGTETLNVNLQVGRLRIDVKPPAGMKAAASFISPMATASVRGTSFEFDTKNLVVLEGTVAFTGSKGGAQLVGAGFTSEARDSGRAADPMETYAAELLLPPLAGNVSGFRRTGVSVVSEHEGDFSFTFNLH